MTALAAAGTERDDTLRRAQRGDHDAFAEIVAAHESMVFGIVWHFFGDRDRSEELAQDVFLQLYRKLHEIESGAHLLFWLRQVAARRCIDGLRRAKLKPVSLETVAELQAAHKASDPLLHRKLQALVAGLPEHQRLVVTLRYQEDLDLTEISRVVEMPLNTVKSHLHRALLALRKKLGEP